MAYGIPQARAGLRDRQITILKRTISYNDLGEPVETWTPQGVAWAQVQYKNTEEGVDAGSKRAAKMTCFKIVYRTDLSESDRIRFDELDYQITGLTELGRRELLEIEAYRAEGQSE